MAITTTDGSVFDDNKTSIKHCPTHLEGTYVLPDSVIEIGIQAFSNCTQLSTILLPVGLKKIAILAFENCKSLESISIPKNVSTIAYGAFQSCKKLKSIKLHASIPLVLDDALDLFSNVDVLNCKLYVPVGSKILYSKANVWSNFGQIIEFTDTKILNIQTADIGRSKKNLISKSLSKLQLSRLNTFI